ncbi:hypothetical protein [Amycolatopsis sp. NPDC051903]|uniref:hypothetical protein n=1 Tax=Amycolatopsis sp. NPDC051903 TaxID=3363936 RepID=UPI0037892D3B
MPEHEDEMIVPAGERGAGAAGVNPSLRLLLPQLGRNFDATSEKTRRLLGWSPRPVEETIVDTAESLLAVKAQPA